MNVNSARLDILLIMQIAIVSLQVSEIRIWGLKICQIVLTLQMDMNVYEMHMKECGQLRLVSEHDKVLFVTGSLAGSP
ncbi:hypothetical protein T08_5652, partial [Trichinella sp. T8]